MGLHLTLILPFEDMEIQKRIVAYYGRSQGYQVWLQAPESRPPGLLGQVSFSRVGAGEG